MTAVHHIRQRPYAELVRGPHQHLPKQRVTSRSRFRSSVWRRRGSVSWDNPDGRTQADGLTVKKSWCFSDSTSCTQPVRSPPFASKITLGSNELPSAPTTLITNEGCLRPVLKFQSGRFCSDHNSRLTRGVLELGSLTDR